MRNHKLSSTISYDDFVQESAEGEDGDEHHGSLVP